MSWIFIWFSLEPRPRRAASNNQVASFVLRTLTLLAMTASPILAVPVAATTDTFSSDGKPISVERFRPESPGKHPAVLYLHGADGMTYRTSTYRESARQLARLGFDVSLVHYFDRTGTAFANSITEFQNFPAWMKTISDATSWIANQPEVDASRIGLMGVSLGSYLGLSVASQDPRIKAVVEFFGGIPDLAAQWTQAMPPVLILHGANDPIVPVSEAYKLEQFLQKKNVPYQMHIYPGQGHGFNGSANEDSRRRAVEFFQKYLGS